MIGEYRRRGVNRKDQDFQITLRVELETARELDKICEKEDISRASMIRRILRAYVDENKIQEEKQ